MSQRSAADLATDVIPTAFDLIPRPEPPAELNAIERVYWNQIVGAVSAEYFPQATHALVTQYARHMTVAAHLAELRHKLETGKFVWSKYPGIIREQRAETVVITNLLRTMRLTHLASYLKDRQPVPDDAGPKPWVT